jgi:hypothetical protein
MAVPEPLSAPWCTSVMRLAAVLVAFAVPAAAAWSSPGRVVPCSEGIGYTAFPYEGTGYRGMLDVVSVPPAYLKQVVRVDDGPWRYWRKAALIVRLDGRAVTVTVPAAWRTRVGITWGNGGNGVLSSLRIAGCGSDPSMGHAFAGGFYLRSPSACVPLVFRVGTQAEIVRFGVGRRC